MKHQSNETNPSELSTEEIQEILKAQEVLFKPERQKEESQKDYKARRKIANLVSKHKKKGQVVWNSWFQGTKIKNNGDTEKTIEPTE